MNNIKDILKKQLDINFHEKKFFDKIINLNIPYEEKIFLILTHRKNLITNNLPEIISKRLKEKIHRILKNKEDLKINITFGSYKKNFFPSFPFIDWAEVFHISFILKIAKKIKKIFDKKIIIEYTLQDLFLEKIIKIEEENILNYKLSFLKLINFFNNEILKNEDILITCKNFSEIFDKKKYFLEFEKKLSELKKSFIYNPKNSIVIEMIKRAKRNWGDISEKEAFEKSLIHLAYIKTQMNSDFYKDEKKFFLIFRKNFDDPNWLPFKSFLNSLIQFWVGYGCLLKNKNKIFPTIIGKEKFLKLKKIKDEEIDIFKNLKNKNLDKISIYEDKN
ncbi:MAG: hypothetical protein N2593_00080 [Patescibacteria group bacterium]|nr:hypothetical protein [Patescibacteria group bacterium]